MGSDKAWVRLKFASTPSLQKGPGKGSLPCPALSPPGLAHMIWVLAVYHEGC